MLWDAIQVFMGRNFMCVLIWHSFVFSRITPSIQHIETASIQYADYARCAQNVRSIHGQPPHCALLDDTLHRSLPSSPSEYSFEILRQVLFQIRMSLKLHIVALHNRSLECFQGYGLVILVVIRVAAANEALHCEEVRTRYVGQPPCRLPSHEHT